VPAVFNGKKNSKVSCVRDLVEYIQPCTVDTSGNVFCSVLQCVTVYSSVWQCVAVCGSVLRRVRYLTKCGTMAATEHVSHTYCSVLWCVAVWCGVLQCGKEPISDKTY